MEKIQRKIFHLLLKVEVLNSFVIQLELKKGTTDYQIKNVAVISQLKKSKQIGKIVMYQVQESTVKEKDINIVKLELKIDQKEMIILRNEVKSEQFSKKSQTIQHGIQNLKAEIIQLLRWKRNKQYKEEEKNGYLTRNQFLYMQITKRKTETQKSNQNDEIKITSKRELKIKDSSTKKELLILTKQIRSSMQYRYE